MGQPSVIIFSSAEPKQIQQLLRHLTAALPHLNVSLLYETPRPSLPIKAEGRRAILSSDFFRSAFFGLTTRIRDVGIDFLDRLLRWLHAAPGYSNEKTARADELKYYAESIGVRFRLTNDSRSQASEDFVRRMEPDWAWSMVHRPGTSTCSRYP